MLRAWCRVWRKSARSRPRACSSRLIGAAGGGQGEQGRFQPTPTRGQCAAVSGEERLITDDMRAAPVEAHGRLFVTFVATDPLWWRRGCGEAVIHKALYEGARTTGLACATLHATGARPRVYLLTCCHGEVGSRQARLTRAAAALYVRRPGLTGSWTHVLAPGARSRP